MKIALVTTTINVPTVLALYAKHGPDVMFFVMGDRKSPDIEIVDFLTEHCPRHMYMGIDRQHEVGWKCSRLIGENCIQRRNIGYLEALRWGADVIVTIDDDNIPLDDFYFNSIVVRFKHERNGLQASSPTGWFDVGSLLQPNAPHRGFPHTKRAQPYFEPVTDAKIGVVAGIAMGDPDIDAVTRIVSGPTVHGVSELLRSGIVVAPDCWTVFNSQNTAFLRELTPTMFLAPGVGRHDDIFASLIAQAVMRPRGLQVHHGRPFVWQQRNPHDLLVDLSQELYGMQTIERLAAYLSTHSCGYNVIENVRSIYAGASHFYSERAIACANAFLDDCETVM